MRLHDFDALTFDCYGTLIDWESGIMAALGPVLAGLARKPPRDEILAMHGRLEAAQQELTPAKRYSELLAVVARRLSEELGAPASWEVCRAYGASIPDWPAFPDTAEALRYLSGHYKLVILSNVDNDSFAGSNRRLGVTFDAIFTAEDIGSYKPAIRNFEVMLGELARRGLDKGRILHVAESLFHDHVPANAVGLRSCWIHRRHATGGYGATRDPGAMPKVDLRLESLGALVAAHKAEAG